MPALEFDFRIAVSLNPELSRSENRVHKEIITVTSGKWSGTFGNGRVLVRFFLNHFDASPAIPVSSWLTMFYQAGGYDLGQARGFRPIRIVEGAFVLQTEEAAPAVFEMRTRGSLSGPCNVLDVLLSPRKAKDIDPRQYSFRMFCTVKAADKRYAELVNCGLWVASGVWKGDELIIEYVLSLSQVSKYLHCVYGAYRLTSLQCFPRHVNGNAPLYYDSLFLSLLIIFRRFDILRRLPCLLTTSFGSLLPTVFIVVICNLRFVHGLGVFGHRDCICILAPWNDPTDKKDWSEILGLRLFFQ